MENIIRKDDKCHLGRGKQHSGMIKNKQQNDFTHWVNFYRIVSLWCISEQIIKNSMNNSENFGKIAGAFLIGAAIGAGLGLLFAPDKGSETRKKIFDGVKDLSEDVKEKVKSYTHQGDGRHEEATR